MTIVFFKVFGAHEKVPRLVLSGFMALKLLLADHQRRMVNLVWEALAQPPLRPAHVLPSRRWEPAVNNVPIDGSDPGDGAIASP